MDADADAAVAVAMAMVAAWNDRDVDRIVDLFAEDGVLHSMMMEPIRGREALRARTRMLVETMTFMDLNVRTIAVTGNTVILERRDSFVVGGRPGTLAAVGVLDIRDGTVAEWREYYDRGDLLSAMNVTQDF